MLARGLIWGKNFRYSDIYKHISTYVYVHLYIFQIYMYTHTRYLFTLLSVTYLAQRKYSKKEGGGRKG